MLVELTRDKIELISRIIKGDRKYPNNEDLFDDFLNETCRRSAAIFESLENEATLETYLRKVVTTSIINVLKDSGRLRRSRKGYVPLKEVPLSSVEAFADKQQDAVPVNIVEPVAFVEPEPIEQVEQIEPVITETTAADVMVEDFAVDTTEDVFSDIAEDVVVNSAMDAVAAEPENSANTEIEPAVETQVTPDITLTSDTTVDDVLDSFIDGVQDFSAETSEAELPTLELESEENFDTGVSTNYSAVQISYLNVKIPGTPEDVAIQRETLEFVADTIKHIDSEYPDEKYLAIYILRYEKGMTQKEIANELEISQSEVSKRLFGLINKVKNIIEN